MVFPRTMSEIGHLLADDTVIILGARVDKRDDTPKLIATDMEIFEPMAEGEPPLRLHLSPSRLTDDTVDRLKELFLDFPGDSEVYILLGETPGGAAARPVHGEHSQWSRGRAAGPARTGSRGALSAFERAGSRAPACTPRFVD